MKFVIVLSAVAAFASGYSYVGLAPVTPWVQSDLVPQTKFLQTYNPAVESTQYNNYLGFDTVSYGYLQPDRIHTAVQDAAGNKVGSYSYIKPGGSVSRTDYVSDSLGYRVASNYPAIANPGFGIDLKRARREVVLPASLASVLHQSHPSQSVYTPVHKPLAVMHPHVLAVVRRSTANGKPETSQKQDKERYPQLNPNPQTNLYTNAKPGQEYASSSQYQAN